jgi:Transglutaminase-like superfamily/TgpA N-terminal domain/Domain of unknown function (DUF4129)
MRSDSRETPLERLRRLIPAGTLPTVALLLLLTICVANSTVSADWVPGSQVITMTALVAVLVMGLLALVRPLPWPAALILGLLAAPVAAYLGARGQLAAAHPNDPTHPLALAGVWLGRIGSGAAFTEEGFILGLVVALFWVAGGWLAWSVLRWQQPLLGVLPGAAVLATNVLNFPDGQNGYVLAFLLLLCGLLLWTTYRRSLNWAVQRTMRLSGEVRWDFWEAGVVVSVVVLVLGIFLPPLSTTDRTVDFQSGIFRSWAELQSRMNHTVPFGGGTSQGGSVGFALDVKLSGALNRTSTPVFTYQPEGDLPGPYYFRGVNLSRTAGGEWQGGSDVAAMSLGRGQAVPWQTQPLQLKQGSVQIQMLTPPNVAPTLLFYPGQLIRMNRDVTLEGQQARTPDAHSVFTVDRVNGRNGGDGAYTATVAGSSATEDQLRQAGADYPLPIQSYRNFAGFVSAPAGYWSSSSRSYYRSPSDLRRIQTLAQQVTAGKTNPYDQAQAIESFLRGGAFRYTLKPKPGRPGEDPVTAFLFDTKEGYCEYFATAMGDMLRSLGIPVRLVNGFGPGTYDQKLGRYVVKESDAHTWVEVYFPSYGWIPFEPTPDGVYNPISRGATTAPCRGGAENCGGQPIPGGSGVTATSNPHRNPADDPGAGVGAGGQAQRHIDWTPVLGGIVLALAVLLLLVSRWLRPRSVGKAWRRAGTLAAMAGVPVRAGETPSEFGDRLALALPRAAAPARELAAQFTIAAYAPAETAEGSRSAALAAWRELRPHLLRGISLRVRRADE